MNQKGLAPIVIILIIVGGLVIGVGTYWYFKKQNQGYSCIALAVPAKNPITGECKYFSTPCDLPDEWGSCSDLEIRTIGWQTYRNEEYGFELKYPYPYKKTEAQKGIYLVYEKQKNGPDAFISVEVKEISFDLQKIKQQFAPTSNEILPEKIIAGNNTFYYYGAGGGKINYPDNYFHNLNGKVLFIQFDGPYVNDKTPSLETKQLEPQILSTFKFIPR